MTGDTRRADAIIATYRFLAVPGRDIGSEAGAFAIGQSVGTWVPLPGLTPGLVERHAAVVLDVGEPEPVDAIGSGLRDALLPAAPREQPVEEAAYIDVTIAFPAVNVGAGFPMLWTTLLGNDPSTGITAMLVDVELPGAFAAAFAGPRLGMAGWRELVGVTDRPLLLNPIKPCTGLPPSATADLAAEVARGGIDLVKDDEVLADAPFNRVADRVRAVRRALDEVAAETRHRARYVVSITDRADRMRDHVRAALDEGADGVMVAALAVGLDGLQAVAEELDGRLPLMAHTAGLDAWGGRAGLGVSPDLVVALCRLAGADAVLVGSPWARRPTPTDVWERMASRLRAPWLGLRPCFPVVGGGVVAEQLTHVVARLGRDVIIAAGGAVNGHPDGAEAGARAMRGAVEEAAASADEVAARALAGQGARA